MRRRCGEVVAAGTAEFNTSSPGRVADDATNSAAKSSPSLRAVRASGVNHPAPIAATSHSITDASAPAADVGTAGGAQRAKESSPTS